MEIRVWAKYWNWLWSRLLLLRSYTVWPLLNDKAHSAKPNCLYNLVTNHVLQQSSVSVSLNLLLGYKIEEKSCYNNIVQ